MNEYRESLASLTDEELEEAVTAAGFEPPEGPERRDWSIDALVRYRESHERPALGHEPEDLSGEARP